MQKVMQYFALLRKRSGSMDRLVDRLHFFMALTGVLKYEMLHFEFTEIFSCLAVKCTSISFDLFSWKIR